MTSSSFGNAPRMKLLCALIASCFAAEGFANPTAPTVAAGAASFNTVGKTLTVTNTPNAIINWKGFSIGAGEITRFQQQNAASAVLNRVVGQDPSAIFGTLSSNGRVFLINPNGVLFGQGSRIDVAGLVASTLNITDGDFLAGRLNFQVGAVAGSVVNQGEIVSASGGRIYLIAPDVQNHGLISSPSGEVVLAAGKTVSLVDADVPNLKVEVQAGGEALNVGTIIAEGGKVGIYAGLINQRGIVRADSVSKDATGRIVFKASDTTILDDGSVTSAAGAKGGEIQVLGNKVGLVGNARIDASGEAGGGTVLVGGDYQGQNPEVQNGYRTYVGLQSSITADAITSGDGGKVVVWSDDATRAYGSISARGGSQSGNGGFVEVSGKNWLDFRATVNTSALNGATGLLLLDPAAVIITNTVDVGGSFGGGNPNIFGSGLVSSTVTWTTIKNHLTGAGGGSNTNVYITTSGSGCSIPGTCGIDILASSGDLLSSNTLRLISHEYINVNGSITNTGSGALEMYAGWDGTSPTSSPTLSDPNGFITIINPISFNGNVLLRANSGISQTASGPISTPNLLASTNSGSVILDQVGNAVGTLAGTFADQFFFKNGQALTIGNVGGTDGITTSASPSDAPSLVVNVTAGNLIVNSPISVTDGNGTTAPTSIALNALSGGISVNNTSIFATAGVDDSANGNTGSVALNASGGGILIANSTVAAHGGNPTLGPGGSATLSLNATAGITANSASTIIALGKAGTTGENGGNASLSLIGGGTIDTSSSTLNALGGAPGAGGTAGIGSVLVAVNSSSGNANPSGDIIVHNITADNVSLQQDSRGSLGAKSILRASPSSLIGASQQLLMEVDDTLSNLGGGSIGTSAAPLRVQVPTLEAHTHYASPGIFIDSPNAQNLQIGGASINSGSVKGVQALAGGDISIGVNGTLTLQSGSANSPCGVGTGGPICTTSGNVTLRAEDMVLGHSIAGTGTVALQPFTQSRQINIESSPSGGVLSLMPSEISLVSTPGALEIGRTDGNATMVVTTFPSSASLNPSTVKLFAGNIDFTTSLGGTGFEFAHSLEMRATNNVTITDQTLLLANGSNLALVADSDSSGVGNLTISNTLGVGNDRTILVGTDGTNSATMQLQGGNVSVTGSGGASMTVRLQGTGTQTVTAPALLSIQGGSIEAQNSAQTVNAGTIQVLGGNTFGELRGGTQNIMAGAGGILVRGGTGTGNNASIEHASNSGTQTVTVSGGGTLRVEGGASGTSNDAQIFSNAAQNISASRIELTGGATGGGVDASNNQLGNFAMIRAPGGSQTITVGAAGLALSGGGGTATNNFALIAQGDPANGSPGTTQTITVGGGGTVDLDGGSSSQTNVIGGSANPNNFFRGSYAMIQANGDSQQISFTSGGALNLTGGSTGSNNVAQILSRFGLQTISGAPATTIAAGDTGGYVDIATNKNEGNFAQIVGNAGQNITAGAIILAGGDAGVGNHAQIFNGSTTVAQQINATSISLTGGAGGGIDSGSTGGSMSNYALIESKAAQTINAADVSLHAGAGGIENFAVIIAPTQAISISGDLSLVGGASTAGAVRGGGARIGGPGGSTPAATNLTLDVQGDVSMTGGSVAGTSIGSGTAGGQTTTITMNVGGDVTLNSGTGSGSTIGSPAANMGGGDISIVAGGNVSVNGGTAIRTLGAIEIDAGGALTLTGGSSGVGQSAIVLSGGDQTITAGSITLNGGAAGGADLNGNFARIRSNSGVQTIATSGDMTLVAGASGINNFASIQAPTQNIIVQGNLSLIGGGSIASLDGTVGGGARIGGVGATTATNLILSVDGNVTMTGGSVADAGASIGSNLEGGQPTTITMAVGGNVTLDPGTVALGGSRIGSPASNIAGGDILIAAGGTVALNSNPGLGTFIRTLGNVTLDAASITQGADSVIQAGTLTTVSSGSQTLNGLNNVASLDATTSGGSLHFTNATTLNVLNGATSGGAVDITVNSGDLNIPGQINAGTGGVTLVAPTGTVNGTGTSPDIVGGTLNITAGNIIGSGGLHLDVPQINSLVATAGQIDVLSLTAATLLNAQASGSIALNSSAPLTIAGPIVSTSGQVTINSPATSFAGDVSLTDYTFGSSTTLQSGTLNLAGTTTVPLGATVAVQGGTLNASSGTVNVTGTVQTTSGSLSASTVNVNGLFDASGGAVTVGSLNVLAGGTLSGTGTIVGNVNNSAGIVSPGASPGTLTINGNYVQGSAGVLDMQIGGLVAGTDYDQLKVIGSASLGGTLNTALINSFVPAAGTPFTLVDASGGISGTFTTVNQPAGALFNSFYGPTTFQFIAAAASSVPAPIAETFNYVVTTTEQLNQPLVEVIETIVVSVIPPATTTTPEGNIVPKPPACN